MKEVCSQTQGRYICHECDVIMRVCNNIWKLLEYRSCLTVNSSASSICHLQQIGSNIVLSSFDKFTIHLTLSFLDSHYNETLAVLTHQTTNQYKCK
jgi:hypothetical protein